MPLGVMGSAWGQGGCWRGDHLAQLPANPPAWAILIGRWTSPDLAEMCPSRFFSVSILNMWLTWQVFIAERFFFPIESKKLDYRDM